MPSSLALPAHRCLRRMQRKTMHKQMFLAMNSTDIALLMVSGDVYKRQDQGKECCVAGKNKGYDWKSERWAGFGFARKEVDCSSHWEHSQTAWYRNRQLEMCIRDSTAIKHRIYLVRLFCDIYIRSPVLYNKHLLSYLHHWSSRKRLLFLYADEGW